MTEVKSSTLSNGVVVLSESIAGAHGVGVSILVDAGPQDEPGDCSGLAHLCEHAFFLGTQTRSERDIAELIDSAGGQLGGFTARDYTCLHATISADYVTYAIDLLGEMITNGQYSEDRLKNEIDVIGHEIDAHEDDANSWIDSELKRLMWPNDPLGRSILGTRETLRDIEQERVEQFVVDCYAPERLVVAAAGQIRHEDFVEQVNDSFWQLSRGARKHAKPPSAPRGGVVVQAREQRTTSVCLMIPAPVYTDPDRYALHVLVTLLGGGLSSRLYRELREQQGIAYSVHASLNAYGRGSVIAIEALTSPQTATQCCMTIFNQLVHLVSEENSITEEELWKAKMQVEGQTFLSSDSISTRVSRLATQQFYFGSPIPIDQLLDQIRNVDMDSVVRVARRVIGGGLSSSAIGLSGGLVSADSLIFDELSGLRNCFDEAITDAV